MNLDEIESFPKFSAGSTSMNRLSPDPYGRWGETEQSANKNLEKIRKAARQLPGSPYLYTVVPQPARQRSGPGKGYYIYVLTPDGEVIGGLDIDDHGKMFEVDKIQVLPKYQGQGLGMSLYGIALSILKKPLVAGTAQTPDSQRAWLRLSQIPGVQVMGLLQIQQSQVPFYKWKVDELGAKPWTRVGNHQLYLFPVIAGKKRMKVAQPKVHKIYGRDTGELYTTMIAFYNQQPVLESVETTVVQENPNAEISQHKKLDRVLIRLCEMLAAAEHPKFGMVAAAVIDPDNRIVAALNRRLSQDKNLHAEPAAMQAYEKRYGAIPDGSIIVTTLSPCAEPMAERQGQACVERINQSNVHKVYCGYMDHTQHEGLTELREFTLEETANPDIRRLCKKYADTFLEDDVAEDYDPNGPPPGPETKPTMPAGTVKVDVSDVYDWYKLGQHISNLKGLGKHDFGQGPPSTIISFGSEEEEHKYIKNLEKTGLTTTDIDPVDLKQPPGMPRQKTDPTYNVDESVTNITELWTQPYELTSRATGPANMEYYFDTKDNRSGRIVFDSFLDSDQGGTHVVLVIVHFYIDNLYHTSGKGDAVAIFSTVVAACRDYLRRYKPPVVTFETPDAKKRNLYVKMSGMFPDYVAYPYPQWVHDPIVGDEIVNSLMDGNANDAVVLRRRDYDPEKTRVYIDEQGPSNDTAISLSKLGKFHPGADTLADFVPERATAQYALHPDKWESTFYSLTNKDSDKLRYYGPKKISIPPGTLVGDMAIANKFYRAKTPEEKQQYAELYRQSLKPYPVDVSAYRMPELLIPRQGIAENFADGKKFVEPNFDFEWEEAERYPEFVKLGKDAWIELAKKGKAVTINSAQGINNTDAADPDSFKLLAPEKQKRALAQLEKGTVEMPIVAVYSDGHKELIGGNTRLTAMMARDGKATIWAFRVPGKQGVAEGQDDNGISFQVQKGKNKFATTLSIGNKPVGVYQYDADTGRSIAEVYPEFKGKGLGKLLVLHAIYTAAQLGLDFQEDESRTAEYDNVLDSLSSNGYIVDDDGYWYVTGEGEQYLQQSMKQGVAEGLLSEIYKMLPTKGSSQGLAIWAYNDALEKKSPIFYNDNNVIIFKANEDLLRYIILQNGDPVLYIGLSKFLDGYKSGTVATEIAGRGKGLAQQAYLNASDILGVPIYSDTTQTDASRLGIWDKLIQQYPNRIVGYDQKTNKDLPLSMSDKGPIVNQNQPIYVNKKDTNKSIAPNQRYRTRILKLLPKKQSVAENFADGKVKGRSRPGRVKRAGASCNGSVTDLRQRAKNASGEKAKMYHWCANMKSGRQKANESPDSVSPQQWIDQVYDMYPQTWQNNHVMPLGGEGEDQQFAMFELVPSTSKKNAVDIKWIQAYPLRQGVGSRAMKELQRLAHQDGITLTLYPWDKGRVSQTKLMKFYRQQGFQPTVKGSKNMAWTPEKALESGLMESWQAFKNSK